MWQKQEKNGDNWFSTSRIRICCFSDSVIKVGSIKDKQQRLIGSDSE
jgi:hypothetical protein